MEPSFYCSKLHLKLTSEQEQKTANYELHLTLILGSTYKCENLSFISISLLLRTLQNLLH